jgi:hypothetical protein
MMAPPSYHALFAFLAPHSNRTLTPLSLSLCTTLDRTTTAPRADPYHVYFQHKIKLIREGKEDEGGPQPMQAKAGGATGKGRGGGGVGSLSAGMTAVTLKDPPPVPQFKSDAPSIMAQDLDILKLTAQFVARNGRSFLTSLMRREAGNYQFDFLRPQHSLFHYFTTMVDQYVVPTDAWASPQRAAASPPLWTLSTI